jgi:mannose-6-phosphate isomerase-like protein (cupin superfamily)
MAVTLKRLDDFDAHSAPERGISMKLARHGLGVESFGMQVIDMSADCDAHPEHDHAGDGQEEVYVVLEGSATLHADGEQFRLDPGTVARVGPGQKRKIVTGSDPVRFLALGGVPGKTYEPPAFSKPRQGG